MEPTNVNNEKGIQPGSRPVKKGVELFPVGEKASAPADGSTRGGGRLNTQISVFNPGSFEEALEIVECLRARAATTISLEKMVKQEAVRLVDFVSGASAALDGDFHKLNEQVYVFCPSNIRIVPPVPPISTRVGSAGLDFLHGLNPEIGASLGIVPPRQQ